MSQNAYNNVADSLFIVNTAGSIGGAIECSLGRTYLTNNNFIGSTANYGGALCVENSDISYCSFTDNNATSNWGGGAVDSMDNNTFLNCTFTSNNALDFYGGAIYINGNTTLTNCTFTNNTADDGGAIEINKGIVNISNCLFNSNSANNQGGAIDNCAYLNLTGSTFTNNTAFDGGAIDNYGNIANLNMKSNNLINNSAFDLGGAISNYLGGIANINFNRIIGNIAPTDSSIYNDNTNGSINATLNWWGSNDDPSGNVNNAVDVSPWLVLTTINTPTINTGSNTILKADLQHDSNNIYHNPVNGHIPDGISVTFTYDSFGNLNPINSSIVDGQVNSTFTAGSVIGTAHPTVMVDNQLISGNIIIGDVLSNIVIAPVSVYYNGQANLTATLLDSNNVPLANQQVIFYVDGVYVGNSTTNASGIATLVYTTTQNVGNHTIFAEYMGNSVYVSNTSTSNLTIKLIPSQIILGTTTGLKGSTTNLSATLTYSNNKTLVGQQVKFYVNGVYVGTATTNTNGVATLSYKLSLNAGNYNILSQFTGTSQYATCNATSTLKITNPPTANVSTSGGLYNTNKVVTITMNVPGNIYYTLNGTTPTTSSAKYTKPLTISATTVLKYLAVDLTGNKSPVYTQTYTIDKIPPKVLSTSPKNLAQNISRTAAITLKFSENIKTSTNWSKIYVKDLNTGKIITISKIISGNTLTIKTGTKSANHWYQIYLPAAVVKDNAGNNNIITTFKYKTN